MYNSYTYFKRNILLGFKGRRIFSFFVNILKSLVLGFGCISRITSQYEWACCSDFSLFCFHHHRLYLFVSIPSFRKEPPLPCSKCENCVNFCNLPQLFFGQTQCLSFQIDSLEKKALNLDPLFLRWGCLWKAIFIKRKVLHYTKSSTLLLQTEIFLKALVFLIPFMFISCSPGTWITFCDFGDLVLGPHITSFVQFDPWPPELSLSLQK